MARTVQPPGRLAQGRRLIGEGDLAWRVEEACFLGWSALEQIRVGDWVVRHGGGLTRRINSGNPAAPDATSPIDRLPEIEALYRRWSLRPRVRLPSFLAPGIERDLEAAGYAPEGETLTLFASIGDAQAGPDPEVELGAWPTPEWLESKARLSAFSEAHADVYRRAVRRLAVPAVFAALRQDDTIAAVAYGALHGRLVCLESVVTDPQHRGKGLGRRLLGALFHRTASEGARGLCLQVQADNAPGIALYGRLGFTTELYRYRYWSAPSS